MPKFEFNYTREEGYTVTFEADSLEHAERLMQEIDTGAMDIDELPKVNERLVHGETDIFWNLKEQK